MKTSDIIAIIALVVSIISIVSQLFPNRRRLKCNKASLWKSDVGYCLTIILENYSRLPISIISLKMIINDKEYTPYNQKTFLYSGTVEILNEDVKDSTYTDKLPIDLNYLSSNIFRTLFLVEEDIYSSSLSLELETTRGKITIKNIQVSDEEF